MTSVARILTYTALALGLAATVTGCTNSAKTRAIETANPPVGNFVDVDGARVHYVQEGNGPDLVLIHGAGGNLRDFTFGLMGRLTDHYRVTAFDRPGHGYTDRVPDIATGAFATEGDSPVAQAKLLKRASAEIGIDAPIVAGHSFGGIVALGWAVSDLDAPSDQAASSVVTIAGVSMPWPDGLGAYYTVNGSAIGGAIVVPILSALATDTIVSNAVVDTFAPQVAPSGYAEHLGATLIVRPDSFRANVRQVNQLKPHVIALSKRYDELTIPVEMIHGDADKTVPIHVHAREFIKVAKIGKLTELVGVGHMPHHVDPEATIAAINRAARRAGLR